MSIPHSQPVHSVRVHLLQVRSLEDPFEQLQSFHWRRRFRGRVPHLSFPILSSFSVCLGTRSFPWLRYVWIEWPTQDCRFIQSFSCASFILSMCFFFQSWKYVCGKKVAFRTQCTFYLSINPLKKFLLSINTMRSFCGIHIKGTGERIQSHNFLRSQR